MWIEVHTHISDDRQWLHRQLCKDKDINIFTVFLHKELKYRGTKNLDEHKKILQFFSISIKKN